MQSSSVSISNFIDQNEFEQQNAMNLPEKSKVNSKRQEIVHLDENNTIYLLQLIDSMETDNSDIVLQKYMNEIKSARATNDTQER